MPSSWFEPTVVIPAASGLLGSIIGGAMAIWGGYLQARSASKILEESQKRELRGLEMAIDKARTPDQFTAAALRLKEFFFRNPEMFTLEPNNAFFSKHLQEIHSDPRPAPQYWDDDRKLAIKIDVVNITPRRS
jgi:hypothetical protein